MATALKRYNEAAAAACLTASDIVSSKSVLIADPGSAEDATIFFTDQEISVNEIQAVLVGSASPSVTDRDAEGTELNPGGNTCDDTANGRLVDTLVNATVPADSWVWLETTAQSGTVTSLAVSVKFGTPANAPPPPATDADWTSFTQITGSVTLYVSSSLGDDANDGLTEGEPLETVAAAFTLLNLRPDGYSDWILFKCGDEWSGSMPDFPAISGASESEPIRLASYGTGARPKFNCGSSTGIFVGFSGGSPRTDNYVAITDIHFSGTGSSGIRCAGGVTNMLIEGCLIDGGFTNGLDVSASNSLRHTNMKLRRNVVVDCTGQGTLCGDTDGLLIEENVFDDNCTSGPQFNHNMYVQNGTTSVVIRGNQVGGRDGMQCRSGGTVEYNLVLRSAHGMQVGAGASTILNPDGVSALVQYNCIIFDVAVPTNYVGWGMSIGNIASGVFYRNVIAHNTTGGGSPRAVNWQYQNPNGVPPNPVGMLNVQWLENVVYDWQGNVANYQDSTRTLTNFLIQDSDFQCPDDANPILRLDGMTLSEIDGGGNRFFRTGDASDTSGITHYASADRTLADLKTAIGDSTSTYEEVIYTNPNLTVADYNDSLGGTATYAAYIAECRLQSKQNWRTQYTAKAALTYIMAGFDITVP